MILGIFDNCSLSLRALLLVLSTNIYVVLVVAQELTTLKQGSQSSGFEQTCYTCLQNGAEVCIAWSLRCNLEDDCDNGEDETYQTCYGDVCVASLAKSHQCDGIDDCIDGRDEHQDKCHQNDSRSIPVFENVSVAVAVIFLVSVMFALTGLLLCICCCCRKGRSNMPYISKSDLTYRNRHGNMNLSNNPTSGHRWAAYSLTNYYEQSTDGSVSYYANNDSVQVNIA